MKVRIGLITILAGTLTVSEMEKPFTRIKVKFASEDILSMDSNKVHGLDMICRHNLDD